MLLAQHPSWEARLNTLPCAMNLSSGCARAVQSAAYCLSIDSQISVEAPCSRATKACAIITLSLLFWVLSLQTSQRRNTILQQMTAPNNLTPTHSLKYETAGEIHEDSPSVKDRSRRVELIWTMAALNSRSVCSNSKVQFCKINCERLFDRLAAFVKFSY